MVTKMHLSQVATGEVNRPRPMYEYSNMAPRLSGQTSIFGSVSFVSKSLLGIERQKNLKKSAITILIYQMWPITR